MSVVISELSDLSLNNLYTVTHYIKCRGSCGHYYFVKIEHFESSEQKTVVVRPNNNLYDYLQHKANSFKFTIMRVQNHLNESYMIVDGNGSWIELI